MENIRTTTWNVLVVFIIGIAFLASYVHGQSCSADGLTCDTHELCTEWKEVGECIRDKDKMDRLCPLSCSGVLQDTTTMPEEYEDIDDDEDYAHDDENYDDEYEDLEVNDEKILEAMEATRSFGERQLAEGTSLHETLKVIFESIEYMSKANLHSLPDTIRKACRNNNELCSFWAHLGECEANQAYMKLACAPACGTCDLIDFGARCPPLSPDVQPALRPGELNQMFERIVSTAPGNVTNVEEQERLVDFWDGLPPYSVKILSKPDENHPSEISIKLDKASPPWLITFDGFLTDDECDKLIEIGHKSGYKRSEDVGKMKVDGTVDSVKSAGRTSENAWCSERDGCRLEELPIRIHERIARVLDIPSKNSEDFQILRYEIGQFYNVHHDYIPNQKTRQCGPRILTFFMYLSDLPEGGGGGTDFPRLGLTVQPKKGSAVLWSSVYNSDPMTSDDRTYHQALPVLDGTKFAMNGWIHMYDHSGPQERGCN